VLASVGSIGDAYDVAGAERADTTPTSEALKQAVRRRIAELVSTH
jgi:hypothetical protein